MLIFSGIVFLIMIGLGLAFNFQNLDTTTVTFISWSFEAPVGLVVITALVIGFLIPIALFLPSILNKNYKIRNLQEDNKKLQKRLDESEIVFDSRGLGKEGEKYLHDKKI